MDLQDLWNTKDKCFAPYSEKGDLKEAVVKSIEYKETGLSYAVVLFSDATEKKVSLSQLCKSSDFRNSWNTSMFDDEDLEKPNFPDRRPTAPGVDFLLSNTGVVVPYTINRYLRDYQRDGVQFLYEHYVRSTGCILGDDMGLGKTIQVFLIVSPLSVLFNWRDELETWGHFKVTVIHGSKKDFELARLKQGKYEIGLTTYETLRLCLDELNSIQWSAVFVDEAHRIKNPKANVTQAMKALKCKIRIGLTGTILQNNMEELWCVLDWAVPGCLGSKNQFKEEFSNPVELGQRHNATKRELATGRKAMQKLALKMSSMFLRRTKSLISNQLPKKEDRIVYCSLSEFQKAVYQTVLETQDVKLVLHGGERCSCKSGRKKRNCCYSKNQYGESVKTLYFSYLTILRKVANHAALLQSDTSTSKKQEGHIQRICSEVFSKFPEFIQQTKEAAFETISDPKYSGKMKVLQQLLNHCRKNKDKVLLFSFSTKLLDVLERYCMASGLEYHRLDGSTKAEDRVKIVKEFNSMQDVNICLVSTMAGGLGLNFVGANVVVVFDPTWNPANDLQAIDRAYRIGQCRDVKVLRLVSLGTVEEMIYLRQVYKQQLHCVVVGSENAKRYFKAVQGSKEHKGELFGIQNLFKLRTQGTCLTRAILEREGQVEAGVRSAAMYISQQSVSSDTTMDAVIDSEKTVSLKADEQFQKQAFDFSSDSDDDITGGSKRKSNKPSASGDCGKQITLQQCGFSRLLERGAKDQDSDIHHSGSSNNDSPLKTSKKLTHHNFRPAPDIAVQGQASNNRSWNISSDSDEDATSMTRIKRQFTKEIPADRESGSNSDQDIILPTQAHTSRTIKFVGGTKFIAESDESDGEKTMHRARDYSSDCISDESDDITIPNKCMSHKTSISKLKREHKNHSYHGKRGAAKDSQTIDAFSSSDDDNLHNKKMCIDHKQQRGKTRKLRNNICSRVQNSIKRCNPGVVRKSAGMTEDERVTDTIVPLTQNVASFDGILGGVAEVAYVHSNQNVVGSSKAENHMSRWAVRDVFELKQFSQLPANMTTHKIEECDLTTAEGLSQVDVVQDRGLLLYPLLHKQKKVHQLGETMFLVGETPKTIRKRHFDKMVAYFKMASAEQLAHHLVNVKSHVRQTMLREFYTSQYSEVEDLYPVQVQLPDRKKIENGPKAKNYIDKMEKRRKKCIMDCPSRLAKEAASVDSYGNSSNNCTKTLEFNVIEDNCITYTRIKKKNSHRNEPEHLPDRDSKEAEPHTRTSPEISIHAAQDRLPKQENLTKKKEANFVTELLGDTSILDDLFSNRMARQSAALPMTSQCGLATTKANHHPKDFWDILTDENDESINRLTDLSVIEKVCESSILPSVTKKDNWDNSLWAENENFLWRKSENTEN
ncbi:DNA excision repair protein ERCC-6-like 2 isoform X2 [Pseudophryne corroboree]|uniref:DNA excision repair protein ERCC-6-like 2 isoform X2 n=1 Tax=Pseudophryne corroboree TaxID=495146 RepID=UPI00308146D9